MTRGGAAVAQTSGPGRQHCPRGNTAGRGHARARHQGQSQASPQRSAHQPTTALGTWAEGSLSSDVDPEGEKEKAGARSLCSKSLQIRDQLPRWGCGAPPEQA